MSIYTLIDGTSAHDREVLHCDLKPSNILLDQMTPKGFVPKIIDFGLAVVDLVDADSNITASGRVAGTVPYMAPEQLDGERLTGACDVYAAGLVLWELLMGTPAFEGKLSSIVGAKVKTNELTLQDCPLTVPDQFADLIRRCTLREVGERPTAGEALRCMTDLGA